MLIIDEIIMILINQFNSLLNIPNLDKYLFDYYLMSNCCSYTSILFNLINILIVNYLV
jgi:hypothetical protein